jgi:hypothetical protein
MTTSWAHVVRGQFWQAIQANIGGTILAAAAAVIGPWLLISAVRGRWLYGPPNEAVLIWSGLGLIALTLTDWAMRLRLDWL